MTATNAQPWIFAGIFLLLVLILGSKYPDAAVALLAVVMLALVVTRWPQIEALIYGR
jgi:hypothetical protein